MKVHLTKFIETPTKRYRLQTTINMPTPNPGWYIYGHTKNPTLELQIEKIIWDQKTQTLLAIIPKTTLNLDNQAAQQYLNDTYGPNWTIDTIELTLQGLQNLTQKKN